MHPSDGEGFEWDEWNERELARHRISPWEVEDVFGNSPKWAPNKIAGSGEWKMVGRTEGGRPMTIVLDVNVRNRWLRVITGWSPPTGQEQAKYLDKA